jgi:hypothetical protein
MTIHLEEKIVILVFNLKIFPNYLNHASNWKSFPQFNNGVMPQIYKCNMEASTICFGNVENELYADTGFVLVKHGKE